MTNEELFDKIRPIILRATGVPEVIFAGTANGPGAPGGKAPAGPYASVMPRQTVRQRGQSNTSRRSIPGDKIEIAVRAQIIASCSVNFFRGDAHMYAERLMECNKHPEISMMLMRAKLGWNGTDSVNDLTALQSGNWEQRAHINIRLMYVTETLSELNNILQVDISLEDEKARNLATVHVP